MCAIGVQNDLARYPALVRAMSRYSADEPDFDTDVQPHRTAYDRNGTLRWFMPPWAKAGVRYLKPSVDLYSLAPEVWVDEFMNTVEKAMPNLEPNARALFEMAERSMQFDLDERRSALDNERMMIDSQKLKRIGIRVG